MLVEGKALVDAGQADIPLALQVGDAGDVFHFYPIQTSFGSQIFGQNPDGSYNADDLQIDNEGGIAFANKLAEWTQAGYLNPDLTFDLASEAFATGRAPYAITGPWNLQTFQDGGVNFTVEAIPSAGGQPSQPFVGVQGFMVSPTPRTRSWRTTSSSTTSAPRTRPARSTRAASARRPTSPSTRRSRPTRSSPGFGAYGASGQPLPNIPAMDSVWGDYGNAQRDIMLGQGDPATLVTDAAGRIREAIAGS
jgi:arabinogalactan oligomer/maltooligosaccharide transport system substrate-binding protein